MATLERVKEDLIGDSIKLRKLYLKVMKGDSSNSANSNVSKYLGLVQSGLILDINELKDLLKNEIEILNRQGDSQVVATEFTNYYNQLENLLKEIHSGARRVKNRTTEFNKDKARGFGGEELTERREARIEIKEAKTFEKLFKIFKEQLIIITNYCENSEKVNRDDANRSFGIIKENMKKFIEHSKKLSELLIDMGFDIKEKFEGNQEALNRLKTVERRSANRSI